MKPPFKPKQVIITLDDDLLDIQADNISVGDMALIHALMGKELYKMMGDSEAYRGK